MQGGNFPGVLTRTRPVRSLTDLKGARGTLIMFICNHCPYVKASIDRIVADALSWERKLA